VGLLSGNVFRERYFRAAKRGTEPQFEQDHPFTHIHMIGPSVMKAAQATDLASQPKII